MCKGAVGRSMITHGHNVCEGQNTNRIILWSQSAANEGWCSLEICLKPFSNQVKKLTSGALS
jgi:hypothetical protein